MIGRTRTFKRNRTRVQPGQGPTAPAAIATFTIDTAHCRLTFDKPVIVNALPVQITRQAAGAGPQLLPTAYTVVSPTVVDLTYAANVVATDKILIPSNCAQIRTNQGGFAAAAVHTF